MSNFHNPYHFVPVKKESRANDLDVQSFPANRGHVAHDRYCEGTYSGRIICRLTTETPIFVGGRCTREATAEAPREVEHFELNKQPAIPGSTLRGLFSSIAEAASNSALRVLENTDYFYRNPVDRKRPKLAATTYTFFEKIDSNLLPFNSARTLITIAEQLFGFVNNSKGVTTGIPRALAGRVYISHAQLEGFRSANSADWESDNRGLKKPYFNAVTLKILDAPKPPTPSLYFKNTTSTPGYIAKKDLRPNLHDPQGRKFYLHHRDEEINKPRNEPWRSHHLDPKDQNSRLQQKVRITPLRPRAVFYFHIDIDNLSAQELGLLLYSLKPTDEFRHKVGMGKPLGLGRVNIEPVGFFRVDRQKRYSASNLFEKRYHESWVAHSEDKNLWPIFYEKEKTVTEGKLDIVKLRNDFVRSVNGDIRVALKLIGNPKSVHKPVHTPQLENLDLELETFKWFVENDRKASRDETPAFLAPLSASSKHIPDLPAHQESRRKR